ncbi:MAG TPA: radical SAM family heme chaperone HemW [Candidatus Limiplasma sp.]|nr:radical SAM family heme chaperone HemW [Candidatus Limiplasma sp.]HRX08646.1 radical SAM family heme chaperone HemW [Candidatus Limiplasma sp.]
MKMSLYIHFPFCRSKCVYCDFCSFAASDAKVLQYIDQLNTEIMLAAAQWPGAEIETVYFGGGTPSIVPARLMEKVLNQLHKHFRIPAGIEFTSEANPGTVTGDWLQAMAEAGMNRLSLGMQAKQDRLLKELGRIHSFSQVRDTLALARRHGVGNLSLDMMYGLPSQTIADYLESIYAAAKLGVQHISAYGLKVEEGTRLQAMLASGERTLPDDDETADMMDRGIEALESLGFQRYEISNFARPGFASRHNLVYWQQQYYLGLGLNAASMLPAEGAAYMRRTNTASGREYKRLLEENRLPVAECIPIDRDEAMFETVMLGLRTTAGIGYAEFESMHGQKLDTVYGEAIKALETGGLLRPVDPETPRLVLNDRGLALQNTALMPFLKDNDRISPEKLHKN